jgi:hypothetical protein
MRIVEEVITPERAAKMLEVPSPIQRKVSSALVREYAADMRDGNWASTAETWSVTPEGAIINGAHRAHAIVASGVPLEVVIAYDVDESSFAFIDIGRRRTAGQFIDGPNGFVIAGAARLRLALDTSPDLINHQAITRGAKINEVTAYVADHPAIHATAETALLINKSAKIHAATMTALLSLASESESISADTVQDWSTGLITGANLLPTDSRLFLRERWMKEYSRLNGAASTAAVVRWGLVLRAWNAFIRGEEMRMLRFRSKLDRVPRMAGAAE